MIVCGTGAFLSAQYSLAIDSSARRYNPFQKYWHTVIWMQWQLFYLFYTLNTVCDQYMNSSELNSLIFNLYLDVLNAFSFLAHFLGRYWNRKSYNSQSLVEVVGNVTELFRGFLHRSNNASFITCVFAIFGWPVWFWVWCNC